MGDALLKIPTHGATLDSGVVGAHLFETKATRLELTGEYVPDAYTKLLLHMTGNHGDTNFIDEIGNTVTTIGNARLSAGEYKFSGTSGLFDGTGDYLTVPNSADWEFGSGDFTIDYWEYRTDGVFTRMAMARDAATTYSPFIIGYSTAGVLQFYATSNGSSFDIASAKSMGGIVLNAWTHYAVARSGNNFYTFQNGILISTWTSSLSLMTNSNPLSIARGQGVDYPGYLDEVRISKGIARWTASFTPAGMPTNSPTATLLKIGFGAGQKFKIQGTGVWIPENIGISGSPLAPKYQYSKLSAYTDSPSYNGSWLTQASLRTALGDYDAEIEALMLKVQFNSAGTLKSHVDDGYIPATFVVGGGGNIFCMVD